MDLDRRRIRRFNGYRLCNHCLRPSSGRVTEPNKNIDVAARLRYGWRTIDKKLFTLIALLYGCALLYALFA